MWNKDLNAYIHIKYCSINETAGKASISYDSTKAVIRLSEILSEAKLVKSVLPKNDDKNQRPYSIILIMRFKSSVLVVGKQKITDEYVQYCISSKK